MVLKGRSTPGHLQQHLTSDYQSYSVIVCGKLNGHSCNQFFSQNEFHCKVYISIYPLPLVYSLYACEYVDYCERPLSSGLF